MWMALVVMLLVDMLFAVTVFVSAVLGEATAWSPMWLVPMSMVVIARVIVMHLYCRQWVRLGMAGFVGPIMVCIYSLGTDWDMISIVYRVLAVFHAFWGAVSFAVAMKTRTE